MKLREVIKTVKAELKPDGTDFRRESPLRALPHDQRYAVLFLLKFAEVLDGNPKTRRKELEDRFSGFKEDDTLFK